MNAKCYRTVFNAARGMLVAVEESARSTGKGRNAGGRSGRRAAALTLTAGAPLVAQGLGAQSLTPDRGAPGPHPVVGVAANGTPVVNINAPSAAGVSANAFTNYNVVRQAWCSTTPDRIPKRKSPAGCKATRSLAITLRALS